MKNLILVCTMFLGLQSIAYNLPAPSGGDPGGRGCLRVDLKEAMSFFNASVGVAKRLGLDLEKLKNDISNGLSREVADSIRGRVTEAAIQESKLCVEKVSRINPVTNGAEYVVSLFHTCDFDRIEPELKQKTEVMIQFASSDKNDFLQAIESGTSTQFANKVSLCN